MVRCINCKTELERDPEWDKLREEAIKHGFYDTYMLKCPKCGLYWHEDNPYLYKIEVR